MDLDIDFEKIMNDLDSSEESNIPEPIYSDLGFSIYRHIPHNDHVTALHDFELAANHIMEELSKYPENDFDQKDKFLEIISNYAESEDWYILYGEDLSVEFELIINDFFNKE